MTAAECLIKYTVLTRRATESVSGFIHNYNLNGMRALSNILKELWKLKLNDPALLMLQLSSECASDNARKNITNEATRASKEYICAYNSSQELLGRTGYRDLFKFAITEKKAEKRHYFEDLEKAIRSENALKDEEYAQQLKASYSRLERECEDGAEKIIRQMIDYAPGRTYTIIDSVLKETEKTFVCREEMSQLTKTPEVHKDKINTRQRGRPQSKVYESLSDVLDTEKCESVTHYIKTAILRRERLNSPIIKGLYEYLFDHNCFIKVITPKNFSSIIRALYGNKFSFEKDKSVNGCGTDTLDDISRIIET